MQVEEKYMARALQLARKGMPYAMPNPMVGAVIVNPEGKIVGEGYHRRCGQAHAEVNAIDAVADKNQLRDCTMYVTLEPCSHQGRTGPCADLIVKMGIPRVVVGTRDPFSKVNGRGIQRLKDAGIEVVEGVMEGACRSLNALFFTAHTTQRPFVMLKWAQSSDGYIDKHRAPGEPAAAISTPLTRVMTHQLRAICDAILVGSGTLLVDNPSLTLRYWPGNTPQPVVLDRRGRVNEKFAANARDIIILREGQSLDHQLRSLYERGITSVLVEGGAEVLQSFIDLGLWDLARIETSDKALGEMGSVKAPIIGDESLIKTEKIGNNQLTYYVNNPSLGVKNI